MAYAMSYLVQFLWICALVYTSQAADPSWCSTYDAATYCPYTEFSGPCAQHCAATLSDLGQWNSWGGWTSCSQQCGGTQTRTRVCLQNKDCKATNGDELKTETQSQHCSLPSCVTPVHGGWAQWATWSDCNRSCGSGQRFRTRTCTNPTPQHGGETCLSEYTGHKLTTETGSQSCSVNVCQVNGGFTTWSSWTGCSQTCGSGVRYQKRCCTNPPPSHGGNDCYGDSILSEACNTNGCPVDGGFSTWSQWTVCDTTCGYTGVKTRARLCNTPPASNGGANCAGLLFETVPCGRFPCPIDGGWEAWPAWSTCSDNCQGVQYKTRCCTNPVPEHNGKPCIGTSAELQDCKLDAGSCPIVPDIQSNLVGDTLVAVAQSTQVGSEIYMVAAEYSFQFTLNIDAAPTAGNIVRFQQGTGAKGVGGPCVDLVRSSSKSYLSFTTDSGSAHQTTADFPHSTDITIVVSQMLDDSGALSRKIIIDGSEVTAATETNSSPTIYRNVIVYASDANTPAAAKVKSMSFYNKVAHVCPVKADIMFVMDSSSSVTNKWDEEKTFVKHLIRGLPVAANKNKVAVIKYASTVQHSIKFNEADTQAEVFTAIDILPYIDESANPSPNTRMDSGLHTAQLEGFTAPNGARTAEADVHKVVILFAEGESTQIQSVSGDPVEIAGQLRAMGVKVFAVGVGTNIQAATLQSISGGAHNYIRAVDWTELENEEFIGKTLDLICSFITHEVDVVLPSIAP